MVAKAVFVDRDGVINEYPGDCDYVKSWEEFLFLPRAKLALKMLADAGFAIFVISNQAGVSKGIYTQEALDLITKNMLDALRNEGANIRGVYYCTHRTQDNCSCRKPKTGLIQMAQESLRSEGRDLDRSNSYFIGDSILDVEAGKRAGLKTVLLFSGKEKPQNKHMWTHLPDFTFSDLYAAAEYILSQ